MRYRFLLISALLIAVAGWIGFRMLLLQWPSIPTKLNVFIITVDSFRPDNLSAYGYRRSTSPNLERLAAEGVRFDRAINQASWTNASMVSIWTSLYPTVHGVEGRSGRFPVGVPTPLHLLRAAGYAVPGVSYLTQTPNYLNLGFQPTSERDPLAWLDAHNERPFFIWLHLTRPHLPYDPSAAALARFDPQGRLVGAADPQVIGVVRRQVIVKRGTLNIGPAERAAITALYDAEVFEVDAQIGRYLTGLAERGLQDSTLVIVGADHGDELGEHGHVGHASTSLAGTLYRELVRVPLIVRLPGVLPRGVRVAHLVEGIDLLPSILDLLRLPSPSGSQGRSFLPLLFDKRPAWKQVAFAETTLCGFQCRKDDGLRLRMVQTPRWKYIQRVRGERVEAEELYDLEDDPHEAQNLAARQSERLKQFAARLRARHAEHLEARRRLLHAPASPISQHSGGSTPAEAPGSKTIGSKTIGGKAPGGKVIVLAPRQGEVLNFAATGGKIILRLQGERGARYRIQYNIGRGPYQVRGELSMRGPEQVYGPFSRTLWLRFPLYNPWRFRVAPEGSSTWSPWVSFTIAS